MSVSSAVPAACPRQAYKPIPPADNWPAESSLRLQAGKVLGGDALLLTANRAAATPLQTADLKNELARVDALCDPNEQVKQLHGLVTAARGPEQDQLVAEQADRLTQKRTVPYNPFAQSRLYQEEDAARLDLVKKLLATPTPGNIALALEQPEQMRGSLLTQLYTVQQIADAARDPAALKLVAAKVNTQVILLQTSRYLGVLNAYTQLAAELAERLKPAAP